MKRFIKKLQQSDEPTKKVWLFVFSGVAMVAIVTLWFFYAKTGLVQKPSAGNQPLVQTVSKKNSDAERNWKSTLTAFLKTAADGLSNVLSQKNNFTISNSQRNFVLENAPSVAKNQLP